jgi:hypothetical protein
MEWIMLVSSDARASRPANRPGRQAASIAHASRGPTSARARPLAAAAFRARLAASATGTSSNRRSSPSPTLRCRSDKSSRTSLTSRMAEGSKPFPTRAAGHQKYASSIAAAQAALIPLLARGRPLPRR